MESVKKARERLRRLPELLVSCSSEGARYADCVMRSQDLKKNDCQKEFTDFVKCMRDTGAKKKVRVL